MLRNVRRVVTKTVVLFLNEVLSLNAQEYRGEGDWETLCRILNEVLSLNAQESVSKCH